MFKSLLKQSQYNFSFTYPCPRKLREIVQLSLFEREPADQIVHIWQEYHKEKSENVSGYLAKSQNELFSKHTRDSPQFILPVKRKGGHFLLLGQAQQKSILYCYLDDYKKHGTHASPYFILTLFDELLFQKGLVLVRGDIINFKISKPEAENIMLETLNSYTVPHLYDQFIYSFNHDQTRFNFTDFANHYQIQS